jgi:DNA polymerase-1
VWPLIEQYTTNPEFDVHSSNASLIYGIPVEGITKEQRYNAKQGVYAGNYKVGALKISKLYDIPFAQAKFILERYKEVRPELELWWKEIDEQIKTTRTIRTPTGRERIFLGRLDDSLFRQAYNHYCQSVVADVINAGLVSLDAIPEIDVLLQVHDELVCQCDIDKAEWGVTTVRNAMEIPITFPGVDVPLVIPAEIAVGPNWYDVKEMTCTTVQAS